VEAAPAIPNVAHFVWGLKPEPEPFHLVHYLCIESCRRIQRPERIVVHCGNRPQGPYWELLEPHVTIAPAGLAPEVEAAAYDERLVPARYRYAHHSDFVRLDALIETGGFYADIDTLFVRPFPAEFLAERFVLGREDDVLDGRTGVMHPSLCNALLLSAPRALFAVTWRRTMAGALDGTWSNHSTLLPYELSQKLPGTVRVEPRRSFYAYGPNQRDLARLLEGRDDDTAGIISIHLWAHLWWEAGRGDFSPVHADVLTEEFVRRVDTTYNVLAREFLPGLDGP
jgi:Glycosyltransferase sugar-binding region containing DXD motif